MVEKRGGVVEYCREMVEMMRKVVETNGKLRQVVGGESSLVEKRGGVVE